MSTREGWAERFTVSYIEGLKPRDKQYEKGERLVTGLRIVVYPGGGKSWRYVWARGKHVGLGKYPRITLAMARKECGKVLQRIQDGEDPRPLYLRPAERRSEHDKLEDIAKPYKKFYESLKRRQGFQDVRSLEVLDAVLKDVGKWRIPETNFAKIKEYRDSLLTKNSARTINRKMQALHPLVVWARETLDAWPDGDPFRNPRDGEMLKPLPQGNRSRRERVKWFGKADEKRIRAYVAGIGGHFEVAVLVALGTGMRPGEIFAMRWEDVRENTIHIPKSKTSKERYARLDDPARDVLKRWRGKKRKGSVLRVKSVKRQWNLMKSKLKITNAFHDCRHTYITRRRAEGMPWATLGQLVGHSETEVTDVYSFIDHELGLVADQPNAEPASA